ncbi:hypothetical protein PROFUN_07799 [Planoprotostelium fungivorum]|uniref:BAR domain-containing protein n=1 Tax=Planoprotostelium fungivorum TaxID=1890364 RepID=A0A2P6MX59_9EUKA|nr:hypothetical protein PROFUN_07799 [Planoprotostelium fungivorum]
MSFWSKTRKSASRTKQAALAKVGASEETIEAGFNYEKERFKEYYAQIKQVEKNAERMMKAMKEFSSAQAAMFDSVTAPFPPHCSVYEATLDAKSAASEMDAARAEFEQHVDTNILKPILRYKMQFKEMKTRMESWEKKRLDLDRYRHDVKGYQKSGKDLKAQAATQKLELATHNFDMLNVELQHDLNKLYEDRIPFMEPIFAALATSGLEYYIASTGAISKTASALGRIDRTRALVHPFIITPREDSAAYTVSSKSFAPRDSLINKTSVNSSQNKTDIAIYEQQAVVPQKTNEDSLLYMSPGIDQLPTPDLTKTLSKSKLPVLPMPPPPPFETLPSL